MMNSDMLKLKMSSNQKKFQILVVVILLVTLSFCTNFDS